MLASLNKQQRDIYDRIMKAMEDETRDSRCFFLDGPGGSGKTYLYKLLLSTVRAAGNIALATASTGIAANLLEGGRTYHSQFKIPIPLFEDSVSLVKLTDVDAGFIRRAKIIILDEATMAPSNALKCINMLLQEIMNNKKPFGGKLIIFGGDFRQTLPVVPHGTKSVILQSCIKFSDLWKNFENLKMYQNVRSVDLEFSNWLINLGDGVLSINETLSEVESPQHMICHGCIVNEIFGSNLKNINNFASYS